MATVKPLVQELAIGSLTVIAVMALLCGYSEGIIAGAIASISGIGGYAIRHNSNKH